MQANAIQPLRAARQLWVYLVPFAIALAVPWLIPGYFAAPVVFPNCAVRQPTVLGTGGPFSITQFHTIAFDGSALDDVAPGAVFCDRNLALSGTALATPDGTQLRLFNVDERGGLYLHEPALTVVNGAWHATQVGPGSNIREIRFMRVSDATSQSYSTYAARRDWGPYPMPADAQTVASIPIGPVPICAELDARQCAPTVHTP